VLHHSLDRWQHRHDFASDHARAERGTAWVMALTAVTMVGEIVAGLLSGSMALLADGWHMATHVAAFGIAIFAYRYARRRAADPSFAFGTGKVTVLGGFASAVALAMVALLMGIESIARLFEPRGILFDEAIWVACIGLAVNLLCGAILHRAGGHRHAAGPAYAHGHLHDHEHGHEHGHGHEHEHGHDDHNLQAAYLHVLADALTSVLAIAALLAGKFLGLVWLDAAMGLVGAALISRWAWGLARDSAAVLLDRNRDTTVAARIRAVIEAEPDHAIADLHVWPLGPGRVSAAVSIVTHAPRPPEYYRERLRESVAVAHLLVEVNRCDDPSCAPEGTDLFSSPRK
jgi:cation diffusion facilitator family transporter